MNITEENIKDLEVVLGLAISSEYLDGSNDKACDRVEKLIEVLKQVKNNDSLHSVSESSLKTAIKHIEDSYCEAHLNTPYMLLGDVTELIKILTGKEVDWQELAKHSR